MNKTVGVMVLMAACAGLPFAMGSDLPQPDISLRSGGKLSGIASAVHVEVTTEKGKVSIPLQMLSDDAIKSLPQLSAIMETSRRAEDRERILRDQFESMKKSYLNLLKNQPSRTGFPKKAQKNPDIEITSVEARKLPKDGYGKYTYYSWKVTVSNRGESPVHDLNIELAGLDKDGFRLTKRRGDITVLAPGETRTVGDDTIVESALWTAVQRWDAEIE